MSLSFKWMAVMIARLVCIADINCGKHWLKYLIKESSIRQHIRQQQQQQWLQETELAAVAAGVHSVTGPHWC
jgi:hypothetical protein